MSCRGDSMSWSSGCKPPYPKSQNRPTSWSSQKIQVTFKSVCDKLPNKSRKNLNLLGFRLSNRFPRVNKAHQNRIKTLSNLRKVFRFQIWSKNRTELSSNLIKCCCSRQQKIIKKATAQLHQRNIVAQLPHRPAKSKNLWNLQYHHWDHPHFTNLNFT